jgi:hypothetical protein
LCCRRKKKPAKFSQKKKPFASVYRPSRPPRRQLNCPRFHPVAQPARQALWLTRKLRLVQLPRPQAARAAAAPTISPLDQILVIAAAVTGVFAIVTTVWMMLILSGAMSQ